MKQIQDTPYYVTPCGAVISMKGRAIRHLRPGSGGPGYRMVQLRIGGKTVASYVHRLVADAYLSAVDGMTVDHGNFDKTDNAVWNLEVMTHSENMKRAHAAGRVPSPPRTKPDYMPDWQARVRDPVTGRFT